MKARITQEGMVNNQWQIVELNEDMTIKINRAPFSTKQKALDRARIIAKHLYNEPLEIVE